MSVFLSTDGRVRAGWRVAFFVLATIGAGFLVSSLAYQALALTPLVGLARQYGVPLAEFGQALALLVGTYASLRIVDGADHAAHHAAHHGADHAAHHAVFDGGPRVSWARVGLDLRGLGRRPMLAGLAAGTLAILVPCALLLAAGRFSFEHQAPEVTSWWAASRGTLFLLAPAAFTEELAMRGYLLTALVDGIGRPAAVAATSLLFALLHLMNPDPGILPTGMVALAGVFLATIRLSTGSLWAASIAHLAWNLVQAVVLHAPVSGLQLPTPGYHLVDHGPAWLTGGTWGPEGGVFAAAGMLAAVFLLARYFPRNRGSAEAPRPVQREVQTTTTAHT